MLMSREIITNMIVSQEYVRCFQLIERVMDAYGQFMKPNERETQDDF